jgi:hypothetical protein
MGLLGKRPFRQGKAQRRAESNAIIRSCRLHKNVFDGAGGNNFAISF